MAQSLIRQLINKGINCKGTQAEVDGVVRAVSRLLNLPDAPPMRLERRTTIILINSKRKPKGKDKINPA